MHADGQENERRRRNFVDWLARLSAIVTVLPASMAAGWLLGYVLVDRLLHYYPWGGIFGTMLGAGAGFYEIMRILMPRKDRKQPPDDEN